ncbi:MAG: Ig-like domain-containing protein [Lysobacterales bacterium]
MSRQSFPCAGLLLGFLLFVAQPATAWEVVNDAGPGVIDLIGQSFRPSAVGDADNNFPPQAANGLAFLQSIAFDVAAGENYPDQIFLFSAPPSVVFGNVNTAGAFAVGQRTSSRYDFDPPLALPFDELTYVVFPRCLQAPATLSSYSGGQNLIPQGGCSNVALSVPVVSGGFDMDFRALFSNPEAALVADYRFDQKDLSSFKAGAPDLQDLGSNMAIGDQVLGQNRIAWGIERGTGLEMALDDQVSQNSYSLVMLLRVDSAAGVSKLIDLTGLTGETGVYVNNKALEFRDNPFPPPLPPSVIDDDTYVQVTLVREQPTLFSARRAKGFVDDQEVFSFTDTDFIAIAGKDPAVLMRGAGRDSIGGAIARVRLFNGALRSPEVRVLAPLPPSTTDIYEGDNTPFEADLGVSSGNFASYRTFHANDDVDWIYVGDRCYAGNYYSASDGLHLHSDDPRFQPIVEVYGDDYLVDTSAPPDAVYGACGQSNNIQFNPGPGHFSIRNCASVDLSEGPVFYTVVPLFPDVEVCGPVATIGGTVIDAATDEPVGGQFILGNGSSTTVSNPTAGSYSLAVTAGVMNLEVVSPVWEGAPVQLTTEPGQNYTGVDILVNRIVPPDDQPIAQDDSFSGPEDVVLSGDLSTNDTLSNDGGNVFSLASDGTRGMATVTPAGMFNYEPELNSNGPDSFSYRITDVDGDVDVANVSLTVNPVNDTPEALPDSATIDANSAPQTIDVLANDNDVDNDALVISSATQPTNGVVAIDASETELTYEPNQDYCNNGATADTFTYTVSDGTASAQATVTITIPCSADILFANGFES